MEIKQYDIYRINLEPTIGFEIQKTRPCLVISPDEMNRNIQTIIIAPMTTKSHDYPTRVKVTLGKKTGMYFGVSMSIPYILFLLNKVRKKKIVMTKERVKPFASAIIGFLKWTP